MKQLIRTYPPLKQYWLLIVITTLAFLLRFLWLDRVPTATNFDQLTYILDARSLFSTGRDVTGSVTLFDIFRFHYPLSTGMQAELPYALLMLTVGPFGLSLVAAAFPNVILGTATVVLMYFIGREFFSHRIGLIAATLTAVNPWLIFSSRTVYEVVPATFFYLLTLYLFVKLRGKLLLWIIPVMLLAFYSYIGTKVLFLPFIISCAVYAYVVVTKKKYGRYYLTVIGAAILIVVLFTYQLFTQPTSRVGDLFLPNNPHVTEQVDAARKTLTSPVVGIYENKLTIYGRTLVSNIFNLASPQYLFGRGDYFFGLQRHGLFYIIDAVFLLVGIVAVFSKNRKRSLFFVSLVLLSITPQVFHNPKGEDTFTPHIALLIPFLLLFIASGIEMVTSWSQYRWVHRVVVVCIIFFYVYSVGNFLHLYFHAFPLNNATFVHPNRVVSRYLVLADEKHIPVTAHVGNPRLFTREYLFYSGLFDTYVSEINTAIQRKSYTLGSVRFVECSADGTTNTIHVYESICNFKTDKPQIILPHLKDSGNAFQILNDRLCTDFPKREFINGMTVADLSVEHMEREELCRKYIIEY